MNFSFHSLYCWNNNKKLTFNKQIQTFQSLEKSPNNDICVTSNFIKLLQKYSNFTGTHALALQAGLFHNDLPISTDSTRHKEVWDFKS